MKLSRLTGLAALLSPVLALASEANLVLPDLSSQTFLAGAANGRSLLMFGILVSVLGLVFGARSASSSTRRASSTS